MPADQLSSHFNSRFRLSGALFSAWADTVFELEAAGWGYPSLDCATDGDALVGRQVYVQGLGDGIVKKFNK